MAIYYKFKSAKDYDSIPIDSHFISVLNLKERIFESKHLGKGTDHDLEVINAQTNEEYPDEAMLIPKNTSVLIRRVPGRFRMLNVTRPEESKHEVKPEDDFPKVNFASAASSAKALDPSEWDDEFGNDLYATIPDITPLQANNAIREDPPPSKADEDSKIKALIETSALDWQGQGAQGFGSGRGFGRGGRMMGGRGFGRVGDRQIPSEGYVCHRCRVPGHFIQHCPTNGDPNFDLRKVKAPTGIPRTMLMVNPEGTIVMPSGAVGVLQPNEAAFEKEMEGITSTRSLGDLPPEFHCPLCKEVMKDAVLTSKCCFTSFCDKCIRDYIISRSICVCGVRDMLADDLLPNKTLRDTISRILSSSNSSDDNTRSGFHVQDMASRCPQAKVASPVQSAAIKEEHVPPTSVIVTPNPKEATEVERSTNPTPQTQQTSGNLETTIVADILEATHESASAREQASQGTALPAEEEAQQKLALAEVKKKKKKKTRLPVNATDMQWRNPQDFAADSFMMPMGPSGGYNPYWNGMQPGFQPGMDGYMGSFGGGMPYNAGYGVGPMDMPFPGFVPHDPFMAQNHMFPMMPPPPRDLGMGFNARPPMMAKEDFEARQANLRRKREFDRKSERDMPKDGDHGREVSNNANGLSLKPKPNSAPNRREISEERYEHERDRHHSNDYNHRPHHSRGSSRRQPDHHHHHNQPSSNGYDNHHPDTNREVRDHRDHNHHQQRSESSSKLQSDIPQNALPPGKPSLRSSSKASVFSRISFDEKGAESNKKRKHEPKSSSKDAVPLANGEAVTASVSMGRKSHAVEYESSDDDDRHFKRRPSRYQPSPPPRHEEEPRRSRGLKDRERERERERERYPVAAAHSSRHR